MTDVGILDHAYRFTMQRFVATGQAPHYTELAAELGSSMEEGKQQLHDLINSGIPAWVHPDTDYIVSFAPFHNLPTQYRMTIDGEQKWFAQWGFEALAVCWLFPGKAIHIAAPCLDCGEPITVEVQDGRILSANPEEIVGYACSEIGGPPENRAWRWSRMNLFRSEAHVRQWASYDATYDVNLQPLSAYMDRFSGERFRARIRPDYISWMRAQQ